MASNGQRWEDEKSIGNTVDLRILNNIKLSEMLWKKEREERGRGEKERESMRKRKNQQKVPNTTL